MLLCQGRRSGGSCRLLVGDAGVLGMLDLLLDQCGLLPHLGSAILLLLMRLLLRLKPPVLKCVLLLLLGDSCMLSICLILRAACAVA